MAEALPLQPGDPRRLGEYEVSGRLGVGEQGAVFLGRSTAGRPVALKLLHVRLSGEPVARSRFTGAFAPARKVTGFCTAAILDADVEGDRPFVVSELVEGPSLQQLVDDEGPRSHTVVERLAVGTAIALAAVHRAGALHHDFKPGNILLGRDGPRVGDFGIARALEAVNAAPTGRIAENPAYHAPEQLSGLNVGPAVDVFAWASTVLFAATGKPPFGDDSTSEVMQRIVYDDPDLSELPWMLREVVADALAKEPAERPTSAGVLERLLIEGGPLASRLPGALVDEGRALATGSLPASRTQPAEFSGASLSTPYPSRGMDSGPASPPAAQPHASPAPALAGPYAALGGQTTEPRQDAGEATQAMPMVQHDRIPLSGGGGQDDDEATALFGMPPALNERGRAPSDAATPAPHLVPGMGPATGPGHRDEEGGTAILAAVPKSRSLPRFRPGNHLLGVALSLTIGVLVGVAIIALVLWPQLEDDEPPTPTGQAKTEEGTIPASFGGTWKGTAVNSASGISFPVEVTFEAGAKTARAVYPKEGCTGALTLTKGTAGVLNMTLAIAKPCSAGNVQVSRRNDGTLQYTWSRPGSDRSYQATLRR